MATRKSDAVDFDFPSVEECEEELKSHRASFPMFSGFNNRTSGWMTHPKRKPIYEIIPRLIFATWNEVPRLDNDCCDVEVRNRCNRIYAQCFRRKVQDLEFAKILKGFKRIHKESLKSYRGKKVVSWIATPNNDSAEGIEPNQNNDLNMKDFFRDFQKFCLDYEKVLWVDNGKSENKVRCVNEGNETQFQIYLTQESNFDIYPEGFDLYYCDWLFGQCQPLGSWQIQKWEVKSNEVIIHFDVWSTLRFYIDKKGS